MMANKARIRWILLCALAFAAAGLLVFLFAPRPLAVEAAPVWIGPIDVTVQDQGVARVRQSYEVAAPRRRAAGTPAAGGRRSCAGGQDRGGAAASGVVGLPGSARPGAGGGRDCGGEVGAGLGPGATGEARR